MKILLIEDDLVSATVLSQLLVASSFTIDLAATAKSALAQIEAYPYDLVILDIGLPDCDGVSLCKQFRASGYTMPILLLTARDSTNDRVIGLESGADDYVVKPYEFKELVARIRALLRRDREKLIQVLTWEQLSLNVTVNIVTYKNETLRLTQKEYGLLELFLRHPQQIFSRSNILDRVWSAGEFPNEEAVTTHIKGLRQKLKAAGMAEDPIETLYGLGYRLKPLHVSKSNTFTTLDSNLDPAAPQPNLQEQTEARVKAKLAAMAQDLIAHLDKPIALLNRIAIALGEGNLDPDLRHQGYTEAHRLIGSLGSLGFRDGSAIARQIEQRLKTEATLVPADAEILIQLIADLEAITAQSQQQRSPNLVANLAQPADNSPSTKAPQLPLLLIVDDDLTFTREIRQEAEILGMRVQVAENLTTARAMIAQEPPDVILLDVVFPDRTDNGLSFLDELAQREQKIPTVMMTAASGLSDRVMAARSGGSAFIEKPASAEETLNAIARVLHQHQSDRSKVMIVDDDPITLKILQSLLERWQIDVTVLQNPQQFWQVLELTAPDLLILDLMMPNFSGIDLCQTVRTSTLWHDLPIVFLSAHSDRDTIRQIFTAGGDDYLSKPIVEADLQTRILSRLKRSRMSRQDADFDGLTGVYTHRRGIQSLTQLLRLATRNHQTLCLAILDLDLFKQVNDRYGHSMGDAVLKQFGNLMRKYFRSEDVTMRWGGEEFVVGLYGADRQKSLDRLTGLLELWRQQKFVGPNGETFSLTFSAGVAEYPEDGSNVEILYRNMDVALYQAKAAGRNRIMAVGALGL